MAFLLPILPNIALGGGMIQMIVVDRNETIRLGVRELLHRHRGSIEMDEAANHADVITKLESVHYNLILVDPVIADGNEETFLYQIRSVAPRSHILVYTELDELHFGLRAIRSGVKGYVLKSGPADELLAAINRVSAGKVHISAALAEEVALNIWKGKKTSFHESLSDREYLVFAMLVCGRSVSSIAASLHLSIKTISTHKARAMAKLRCKNFSDMVQYSIRHNLTAECEARCADR